MVVKTLFLWQQIVEISVVDGTIVIFVAVFCSFLLPRCRSILYRRAALWDAFFSVFNCTCMLAAYFFGNIYKPGVLLENLHLSICFLGKSSTNGGFSMAM